MRIILSGATGAMGKVVASAVTAAPETEIVFGWADAVDASAAFSISPQLDDAPEADVIIDFSVHSTIGPLLDFALKRRLPVVIATTGHTAEEIASIEEASKQIPIFHSGNMSIGVYVLKTLTEQVAQVLSDFDIEIIEKHHHLKKDAPSGTAKMLLDAAQSGRSNHTMAIYGREGMVGQRTSDEIGVHAVRGGTIVGEHTVLFAGTDEIVELKHTALSKMIFAKGALRAASFLAQAAPGLYNMNDICH